jgi:hypothetical protein
VKIKVLVSLEPRRGITQQHGRLEMVDKPEQRGGGLAEKERRLVLLT